MDNGICPHCGRADAVVEREPTELYDREGAQLFECRGCGAGVRRLGVSESTRLAREARCL